MNLTKMMLLGVVVLAGACGGETPAPKPPDNKPADTIAPPQPTAPPSTTTAAAANTPPPDAEPTTPSDDDKKRVQALSAKLAPYVDAFANVDAQLSKDKKKVLFRSNRDGLWKAYVGDPAKPNAEPKKLTDIGERVASARTTPDDKWVLYTSDTGADEQFAIFKVGLDGAGTTNLTPGDKLRRDPPFVPRHRPTTMVYSARALKESGSRVYVQDIGGTDAKQVYKDEGQIFVVDVSPDGGNALVTRVRSESDSVVFRLDLDNGKMTRLYPREGKVANITDASFSADGKRVYVATDDGQETANVVMIEHATGVVSARYKEEIVPTGQLDYLTVSPKDDRVALSVNAGNHTEVRVLDAKTLKLQRTVKTPVGVVANGRFTEDGAAFTMRMGTPDKPNDIYEVDAASGNFKPLRADVRPGLKDAVALDVTLDKTPAFDGLSIPINVYLPKQRNGKQLPVVVGVHGGPSASSMAGYNPVIPFFAGLGYAWVEPNIRGSTGFGRAYEMADNKDKRGDALKDLESVNAWVKAQPWCDDDRVVISGGSYGGYIVLMALTRQPSLWRAGVDYVGVSSLTTLMQTTSGVIRAILTDEFGDLDKERDLLDKWSPLRDIAKINAPLFVYQGQNDPRVPRSESDQVVNALRSRNVPVEYMIAANEGHSYDRRETKLELFPRVARFLADQMKAPPAK